MSAPRRRAASGATLGRCLHGRHAGEIGDQGHAADDVFQDTGIGHDGERRGGAGRHQELHHFGAHALTRQAGEPLARIDRGGEAGAVGGAAAIGGVEAEEAQDAQIVLGDAPARIADEPHHPGVEVGEPVHIVVELAFHGH